MFWSTLDLLQAYSNLETDQNCKVITQNAHAVGLTATSIICYPSYCHTLQHTPTMTQCSALCLHRAQDVLSTSLKPKHALSAVAHDWLWVACRGGSNDRLTPAEMLAKNLELSTSCLVSNPDPPHFNPPFPFGGGSGYKTTPCCARDNSPWEKHIECTSISKIRAMPMGL